MITRLTRWLLAIQGLLGIGLALLLMRHGLIRHPWLAIALGALVPGLLRFSITINSFVLARRYRSPVPPCYQLDWHQTLRMVGGEFRASMLSSSWTMPFHAVHQHIAGNPRGLPVLLIHGYGCNSGYWRAMSTRLAHAGITHHAVDLEPVLADIDHYVPALHAAMTTLIRDSCSRQLILLAHSMGGLVCRAYLRKHGAARIAGIITLGTPHHGTRLARFGIGKNSQQMQCSDVPGTWLGQLEKSETPASRRLFVSLYSHHDNIVAPQLSAHFEDATNIAFHGIGHVALALDTGVQQRVITEILSMSAQYQAAD